MPLWLAAEPLVLASASKSRQTLLKAAGVPIEACPADLDERRAEAEAPFLAPDAMAALLARKKAAAVERTKSGRLVLGADQVLALDSQRFAKPVDRATAEAQLHALCGRTHELHCAIAFAKDASIVFEHRSVARLTMRAFSDRFVRSYLDAIGSAASDSVGAYQLEGLGIQLFERVEGDYFTVLGLPLLPVLEFLRRQGSLLT